MKSRLSGIYILVVLILLLRIPALYFWNGYLTGDDASLYMETAINVSEGNGYYASMCRHISDRETLIKYIENNGVSDRMEWIPPLYISMLSGLYGISGFSHFMLAINIFNLFLFGIFLFMFLRFLFKEFPDNYPVIFISLFFVGFNFLIFEFTFGAHMESLYLLTFFIAMLAHLNFIKKDKPKIWDYLLYSFALSLFLFSKYSSIPFVAAFVFHHLVRKNMKSFFIISILTLIMISPWMFIRSYLISGHPLSQILRGNFPFSDLPAYGGFGTAFFYKIYTFFRELTVMLAHYLSIDYFFFLVPFAAFFLINKKQKNPVSEVSLILFIFAFVFFGFIFRNANGRYQILLLIPILPFAIKELLDFLNNKSGLINKKLFLSILLLIIFGVQMIKITEFYNQVRHKGSERAGLIEESLSLISKAGIEADKTILVNIEGLNVFTSNMVVLTPRNINSSNKQELIEIYGIDYVLFAEEEGDLRENVFLDLKLIEKSGKGKRIYLYKINNPEN